MIKLVFALILASVGAGFAQTSPILNSNRVWQMITNFVGTNVVSGGSTNGQTGTQVTNIVAGMTGPGGSNFISSARLAGSNYLTGLLTNANQFGASTTLTLKDGVRLTNASHFGVLSITNNGDALVLSNGTAGLRIWQDVDAESILTASYGLLFNGPFITIDSPSLQLGLLSGVGNGKVLTSDGTGDATWQANAALLTTNANQFGANTTLTLKTGAYLTNAALDRATNFVHGMDFPTRYVYWESNKFGIITLASLVPNPVGAMFYNIGSSNNSFGAGYFLSLNVGNYASGGSGAGGIIRTDHLYGSGDSFLNTAYVTNFSMTTAPVSGYVLTSDAFGVSSWQVNPALGVSNQLTTASNFFNARQGGSAVLTNLAATGAMTNGLIAGANMTLTTNGAHQVVFTASGGGGGVTTNANQFGDSPELTLKVAPLITNLWLNATGAYATLNSSAASGIAFYGQSLLLEPTNAVTILPTTGHVTIATSAGAGKNVRIQSGGDGGIQLGASATVGHVWTATNTSGVGNWVVAPTASITSNYVVSAIDYLNVGRLEVTNQISILETNVLKFGITATNGVSFWGIRQNFETTSFEWGQPGTPDGTYLTLALGAGIDPDERLDLLSPVLRIPNLTNMGAGKVLTSDGAGFVTWSLASPQSSSLVLSNIANTGAMTNGLVGAGGVTLTTNGSHQVVITGAAGSTNFVTASFGSANITNTLDVGQVTATNLMITFLTVPVGIANSNLTLNFNIASQDIYLTNSTTTFTNIAGLVSTNQANITLRITPEGANRTITWPTLGGSSFGARFYTNANSPIWTTITNPVVVSMSAWGTNVHISMSEWK